MYLQKAFGHMLMELDGKEHCWESPPAMTCTKERPFVMDGCPNSWEKRRRGFKVRRRDPSQPSQRALQRASSPLLILCCGLYCRMFRSGHPLRS
jgi:hypothetical protein